MSRRLGGLLLLASSAVLLAAVFVPWYAYEFSSSTGTDTQLFHVGIPTAHGTLSYACTGERASYCPASSSYSAQHYGATGTLVEAAFLTTLATMLVGALAAVSALLRPRRWNGRRGLLAFGGGFAVLAAAAPLLLAFALPSAQNADVTSSHRPPTQGPWASFVGSASFTQTSIGTATLQWGPGLGWYLSLVAVAVGVAGIVFLLRSHPAPTRASAGTEVVA